MSRRLLPIDTDEAIDIYEHVKSLRQTANQLGVSKDTVRRILQDAGTPIQPPGRRPHRNNTPV